MDNQHSHLKPHIARMSGFERHSTSSTGSRIVKVCKLGSFGLHQARHRMMGSAKVLIHRLDSAHELTTKQAVLGHELATCSFQQKMMPIALVDQGDQTHVASHDPFPAWSKA